MNSAARCGQVKNQRNFGHGNLRPISGCENDDRILGGARSLDKNLLGSQVYPVLRRLVNYRFPKLGIRQRFQQSNLGPAHCRYIFQIIFEQVIGEFAGRELPCDGHEQREEKNAEYDFNLAHNAFTAVAEWPTRWVLND